MIDTAEVVKALKTYRKHLQDAGSPLKAAAVAHCIGIVKRISIGGLRTFEKERGATNQRQLSSNP